MTIIVFELPDDLDLYLEPGIEQLPAGFEKEGLPSCDLGSPGQFFGVTRCSWPTF